MKTIPVGWILVILVALLAACGGGDSTPLVIVLTATPTSSPPIITVVASPTSAPARPTAIPPPVASPAATVAPPPTAIPPPTVGGWTASFGGPGNARANPDAHPGDSLTLLWEWGVLGDSPVALAAVGGRLFVLSDGGSFCVLDAATGAEQVCRAIWPDEKPLSTTDGKIALTGDTVIIGAEERFTEAGMAVESTRGLLAAFSSAGQSLWSWPVTMDVFGYMPVVAGNTVAVAPTVGSNPAMIALDPANGQELWRVPGYDRPHAGDGTTFYADTIAAFRADTGERLWEQKREDDPVLHLAYAGGRLFASAFDSIAALDAAGGRELWRTDWDAYPAEIAVAQGLVFAAPSAASSERSGDALVALDAADGRTRWTALPAAQWSVVNLVAAADAVVAIARDRDWAEYLLILNATDGRVQQQVALGEAKARDLAVDGDRVYILGETLRAYGPGDRTAPPATPTIPPTAPPSATPSAGAQGITPANVGQLSQVQQTGVGESARSLTWSPDSRFLALSQDGKLHLYRADTLEPVALPQEIAAGRLAWSPDGRFLAVTRVEGTITNRIDLWQVSDWSLVRTLEGHDYSVMDMAFSPDGRLLASASTDARLRLWDVEQGTLRHDIKATYQGTHPPMIFAVAFSPDGQRVWAGLYNSTVQGWQVSDGMQITAFHTRGSVQDLFAGTENRLWTLTSLAVDAWLADGTNRGTMTLEHGGSGGDMSGDGVLLAVFGSEGIEFWDLARQQQAAWLGIGYVGEAAFSPDGSSLAVLREGKNLEIWQPTSGAQGDAAARFNRVWQQLGGVEGQLGHPSTTWWQSTSERLLHSLGEDL